MEIAGINSQQNPVEGRGRRVGAPLSGVRTSQPTVLMAIEPDFAASQGTPLPAVVANTVEEALTAVARERAEIRCAVVQVSFGGGRGIELIHGVRALRPLLPILLFAQAPNQSVLSLSYAYDLELVTRACSDEIVSRFVQAAMARQRATYEQLEQRLTQMAERQGLTTGELRIVTAVTRGMTRAELISAFDVSVNTLKSQTRSILKKTGHASLGELSRVALTGLFTAPA